MKFIVPFIIFILALSIAGCSNSKLNSLDTSIDLSADRHRMPDGSIMAGHEHPMLKITSQEQFLLEMIPHHQEAVDTSKILLESTTNNDLKLFLEKVIQVQTLEIDQMKLWLVEKFNKPYDPKNAQYMPMMGDLTRIEGTLQAVAYINGMIVHHQGAISMSEQLLDLNNIDPDLKLFAETIISTQTQEIDQLINILGEL